jgi:hypothetical protein
MIFPVFLIIASICHCILNSPSFSYVYSLNLSIFKSKTYIECNGFFCLFLLMFVLGIVTSDFECFKVCSCCIEIDHSHKRIVVLGEEFLFTFICSVITRRVKEARLCSK